MEQIILAKEARKLVNKNLAVEHDIEPYIGITITPLIIQEAQKSKSEVIISLDEFNPIIKQKLLLFPAIFTNYVSSLGYDVKFIREEYSGKLIGFKVKW